jgi:hypothetical protein
MTRCYAEPVEVRRQKETPAQFLWRDRLYVVREVLDSWVESGSWWQRSQSSSAGSSASPGSLDDAEREYWRVEAAAGRSGGSGVYDLCFDWSAGTWTLTRTMD